MILQEFIPLEDLPDVVLEGLAVVGYLFVFVMAMYARKKNRIFASKGFPLLLIAIGLGFVSVIMDFISEFAFIVHYELFKFTMMGLQLAGLILFTVAMALLFKFTQFMMGESSK